MLTKEEIKKEIEENKEWVEVCRKMKISDDLDEENLTRQIIVEAILQGKLKATQSERQRVIHIIKSMTRGWGYYSSNEEVCKFVKDLLEQIKEGK